MNTTNHIASSAPHMPTANADPQPYEVVRFNALKHGILSRYTVLSHESHADYECLVNSLIDENMPVVALAPRGLSSAFESASQSSASPGAAGLSA